MRTARRLFVAAVAAACFAATAHARYLPVETYGPFPALEERISSDLLRDQVPISVDFNGTELTVYGAVRRSRFLLEGEEPPDIAIAVIGPEEPLAVRRKARRFGVWTGGDEVRIASAPQYYAVASTRPLNQMLRPNSLAAARIRVEDVVQLFGLLRSVDDPTAFREAVLRLRRAAGLYQEFHKTEDGGPAVRLIDDTLFRATFSLPANITQGDFRIRVILARNGHVVDDPPDSGTVYVRRSGLERHIYSLATTHPLLYGIGALLVALFAGWSAAEVFRRIRS